MEKPKFIPKGYKFTGNGVRNGKVFYPFFEKINSNINKNNGN